MTDEKKDLLKRQAVLHKRVKKIQTELQSISDQIFAICKCEEVVVRSSWSYGGYDHQGEDRTWDQCIDCGRTSNLKVRYTGFG